jgi:hypothetical protein
MSRGYGAMLLKKSAAGLDHLKCNVSKFSEATLCQILVRTWKYNSSQCADPHAHEETAMVRNELSPKSNCSNHCSFTKTRPEAKRICESVVMEKLRHGTVVKFGDWPKQKCPESDRVCHGIPGLVGVLRRFLTLKSVSDPCQSTNRKHLGEIDLFRTILGVGRTKNRKITESRLFQRPIHGF